MKTYNKLSLMLLLCLLGAAGFAQVAKTKVFSQFPETVDISRSQLSKALTAEEGATVTLHFSSDLVITGTVVANVQKYDNLQSMVIKSEAFANALFHLSKVTNKDNTVIYLGRILSEDAADGYEIKSETAGIYQLKKVLLETIYQPCTQ